MFLKMSIYLKETETENMPKLLVCIKSTTNIKLNEST